MTIQEAAKRWNVSEKTIFGYILQGYIYELSVENNEIQIPQIPKPYIRKKPKTIKQQDNYILTAMDKGLYVNASILGMDQRLFEERLSALIKANKIYSRNSEYIDYTSNLGFVLASLDKKNINITLAPTVEVKIADQIGLINGEVSLI